MSTQEVKELSEDISELGISFARLEERVSGMDKRVDRIDSKFWWIITFTGTTLVATIFQLLR